MVRVRVVVRLRALATDVVHDLVFALAGDVGVGENDLDALPARVIVQAVMDVVAKAIGKSEHEGGSLEKEKTLS